MDTISFHSFWTLLTMLAFIAMVVWVWSGKQKSAFDKASRIPLEDDIDSLTEKAGQAASKEDRS